MTAAIPCRHCKSPNTTRDAHYLLTLDVSCLDCGWFSTTNPSEKHSAGNHRRYARPGPDFIGPHYATPSMRNVDIGPLFWEVYRPAPSYIDEGGGE